MKSSKEDLKKRGFIEESDIEELKGKSKIELFELLLLGRASDRTASVRVLSNEYLKRSF